MACVREEVADKPATGLAWVKPSKSSSDSEESGQDSQKDGVDSVPHSLGSEDASRVQRGVSQPHASASRFHRAHTDSHACVADMHVPTMLAQDATAPTQPGPQQDEPQGIYTMRQAWDAIAEVAQRVKFRTKRNGVQVASFGAMPFRGRTEAANNRTQASTLLPLLASTLGVNESRAQQWTYVFTRGRTSSFHTDAQKGDTFIACLTGDAHLEHQDQRDRTALAQ
eukprot:3270128-Amphidinium_carterae.1